MRGRSTLLSLLALLALAPSCVRQPAVEDPDAGPIDDGGGIDANVGTGSVRIVVEPSDDAAGLLAAIAGAQTSVHLTVYLLTDQGTIDALIARHQAGVEVQVLLNRTFPTGGTSNDSAYAALRAGGVDARWAPSTFSLTHEKCVIIDHREAWIMTMNMTPTSYSSNREFLAVDTIPAHVADAEAIFAGDFAGTPISTYAGELIVSPLNAVTSMHNLIQSATSTIDIEAETLSDSNVVSALVGAVGRGVTVRVVLAQDSSPTTAQMSAITNLKMAGVSIHEVSSPYIHSKALVVDGVRAYVGSENFTYQSLNQNRELGLIVTDAASVQTIASTIAADYASGRAL
jgi:phosphatidylserine/phosphatidylglycerophosphate/cardiolipin synthase-like enzyme